MKQLVFIFLSVIFLGSCKNAGNSPKAAADSASAPYMYFAEDLHNFGNVTSGEKISYTFTFENRGKSDLVINDVETSCGCTASKYNNKPIAPGEKGSIELIFSASGEGKFRKRATVKSNAIPDEKVLTITGEILSNNSK